MSSQNRPKYPCLKCEENVNSKGPGSKALQCSFCKYYIHKDCADVSDEVYSYIREQQFWVCKSCKSSSSIFKKQLLGFEDRLKLVEDQSQKNSADIKKVELDVEKVNKKVEDVKGAVNSSSNSVQDAVFAELLERENKKNNLILHGVPEAPGSVSSGSGRRDTDVNSFVLIMKSVSVILNAGHIKFCNRLGEYNDNAEKPRPLLIGLMEYQTRSLVLDNARKLSKTDYKHVNIVPDLTVRQRKEEKKMYEEAEVKNSQLSEEYALNWVWRLVGPRGQRRRARVHKNRPQEQQQAWQGQWQGQQQQQRQELIQQIREERQQQQDLNGGTETSKQREKSSQSKRGREEDTEEECPPRKQ